MVIEHNNTELTTVRALPGKKHHSANFKYTFEDDQLAAIISQSEHCEQEVAYHCKKSRLFNTPGVVSVVGSCQGFLSCNTNDKSLYVFLRWFSTQLVGGRSSRGTSPDVLGWSSTRKPAVCLWCAREVPGSKTPLQL